MYLPSIGRGLVNFPCRTYGHYKYDYGSPPGVVICIILQECEWLQVDCLYVAQLDTQPKINRNVKTKTTDFTPSIGRIGKRRVYRW